MFGGGVACYVRSDLPARIVYNPKITCIDENEVLAIELKFKTKKLFPPSVYRHPHDVFWPLRWCCHSSTTPVLFFLS
ncbi:hypothetical protein TKK_0014336 [Trichogramma kaykai]